MKIKSHIILIKLRFWCIISALLFTILFRANINKTKLFLSPLYTYIIVTLRDRNNYSIMILIFFVFICRDGELFCFVLKIFFIQKGINNTLITNYPNDIFLLKLQMRRRIDNRSIISFNSNHHTFVFH